MANDGRDWPFHVDSTSSSSLVDELEDKAADDDEEEEEAPRKTAVIQDKRAGVQVVGTTQLYEDGRVKFIPTPTPDPKDPLNLPDRRRWAAVAAVSFRGLLVGAVLLSTELVISGLWLVFVLEYSGVNPQLLAETNFTALSTTSGSWIIDPLAVLPAGTQNVADLNKVSLLSTLPLLVSGLASYVLVPLATAVGRRPVLLLAGACAWAGGIWAGLSGSLDAHLAARLLQSFGVGAVGALIPLVVQDITFIHQRNTAMAVVFASQGLVLAVLGVAAPYLVVNYAWQWIYFTTSGIGCLAWLAVIGFAPETSWPRSKEELAGQRLWRQQPGGKRAAPNRTVYTPRTMLTDFGVFHVVFEWRNAARASIDIVRTSLFPAILWSMAANTILFVAAQASVQFASFALLAQGIQFQYSGIALVPFGAASVLVLLIEGPVASRLSAAIARRRHDGIREPEHLLPNLIAPFVAAIAGSFIFGSVGQDGLHWAILLVGAFLIAFAALGVATIVNIYVVESYPMLAGPVLVNVSSQRLAIAFLVARPITTLVARQGLLGAFALLAEIMIVVALGLPALWFGGKKARQWTAGTVAMVRVRRAGVLKSTGEASAMAAV